MKKVVCMVGIIGMLVFTAGVVFAQTTGEQPGNSEGSLVPPEGPSAPVYPATDYQNFSTGQRWGTWALNAFTIPGFGSYFLMHDILGGTVQLVAGGLGIGFMVASGVTTYRAYTTAVDRVKDGVNSWGDDLYSGGSNSSSSDDFDTEYFREEIKKVVVFYIVGSALLIGNFVFNIVRSATYDKPQPKAQVGSLADPNAWSFAILPGKDGVEAVSLAYTLRY